MTERLLEKLDAWAAQQDDKPGRSEAVRRLIEIGLSEAPTSRKRGARTSREK